MLSYPDSKELEKLGYSQELKMGDWVYYKDSEALDWEPQLCDDKGELQTILFYGGSDSYVKVPTTDGMIEGLRDKIQHITPLVKAWEVKTYNVVGETHFPGAYSETEYENFVGTTLEQALCELWKKVKK